VKTNQKSSPHVETADSKSSGSVESSASMSKEGARVTIVGMIINVFLTALKIIFGIFGHSAALIADGLHSLSDLMSDIVVIFSIKISARPEDDSHNYGHGKIETLASAVVGLMLLAAGGLILYEGVTKIYDYLLGVPIVTPAAITFYIALLSIIVKELLYQYTHRVAKKLQSDLIEVNAWHHRSDAFSSVGVAAGIGIAVLFGEKWAILDPIVAVILAAYILYIALKILYNSLNDLMEASLPPEVNNEIIQIISECSNVLNIHSLKTRKLGSAKAIDVHIMIEPDFTVKESYSIQKHIEKRLKERFGAETYVIIKVEPFLDNKIDRERHILEGL
jgi:cation diffusion facilitator family transporter